MSPSCGNVYYLKTLALYELLNGNDASSQSIINHILVIHLEKTLNTLTLLRLNSNSICVSSVGERAKIKWILFSICSLAVIYLLSFSHPLHFPHLFLCITHPTCVFSVPSLRWKQNMRCKRVNSHQWGSTNTHHVLITFVPVTECLSWAPPHTSIFTIKVSHDDVTGMGISISMRFSHRLWNLGWVQMLTDGD